MEIRVEERSHCVVAVGSTQFDELIAAVDCAPFYDLLAAAGIKAILFQVGSGRYLPLNYPRDDSLVVEVHRFIVLEDYINSAALLISHCGAGTLLEGLRADSNPVRVAVINSSLMDNHQAELADQLDAEGLIIKAEPQTVLSKLKTVLKGYAKPKRFPARTDGLLVSIIDEMLC